MVEEDEKLGLGGGGEEVRRSVAKGGDMWQFCLRVEEIRCGLARTRKAMITVTRMEQSLEVLALTEEVVRAQSFHHRNFRHMIFRHVDFWL